MPPRRVLGTAGVGGRPAADLLATALAESGCTAGASFSIRLLDAREPYATPLWSCFKPAR